MVRRPSARLLLVDRTGRLLLFRFAHKKGALAGQSFWATPGGGLEPGESFESAAIRELREETGMVIADPGPAIATRRAAFTLPTGDQVEADERYFLVRVEELVVSSADWTADEKEFMTEPRWWSQSEVATASEQIWPETLAAIMGEAGVWKTPEGRPQGPGSEAGD